MTSLISIVMLTWNGLKFTKECVESVMRHSDDSISIQFVFVDNGSSDGTVDYLRTVPVL